MADFNDPIQGGPTWWRNAVVYQVYVRSFADSDGDGIGDLPGITSRLPYLRDLGVDALWITPFYTSPQHDHGYDVADYTDVDPLFGTLGDADALIARAHELDLRVIVDLVPNHTSDEHVWFQAALAAGPGSPERARYMFREGSRPRRVAAAQQLGVRLRRSGLDPRRGRRSGTSTSSTPPSPTSTGATPRSATCSRTCCASGSTRAWTASASTSPTASTRRSRCATRSSRRASARPPARSTATTRWCPSSSRTSRCGTSPRCTTSTAAGAPSSTRVGDDRMAVAEAWTQTPESMAAFVRPDELDQAFNFAWLLAEWSAESFREVVVDTLAAVAPVGASPTWVLSNHDVVRHVTRYGGGEQRPGPRPRRDAGDARAARLLLPLPGRGARPRAGRRRPRGPAGPVVVPHRRGRPRRLPGADPVGRRLGPLRLRPGRRPSRGSRSPTSSRASPSRRRPGSRARRWSSTAPRSPPAARTRCRPVTRSPRRGDRRRAGAAPRRPAGAAQLRHHRRCRSPRARCSRAAARSPTCCRPTPASGSAEPAPGRRTARPLDRCRGRAVRASVSARRASRCSGRSGRPARRGPRRSTRRAGRRAARSGAG